MADPTTQPAAATPPTDSPGFWAVVAAVAYKLFRLARDLASYSAHVREKMREEVTAAVYREMEGRFEYLYQQLEKRREENDQLRTQNARQQGEIDDLKGEINSLKAENQRQRDLKHAAVQDVNALTLEKTALERQLEQCKRCDEGPAQDRPNGS